MPVAALPRADIGELSAASLRARAHRELAAASARLRRHEQRSRKPARSWLRAYNRFEPLLIAAIALIYLGSTANKLALLLG